MLENGRIATKMAFGIEGKAHVVLNEDLSLKGFSFADELLEEAEQAEDDGEALVRLEADFIFMAQALAEIAAMLVEALGGEAAVVPSDNKDPSVSQDGQWTLEVSASSEIADQALEGAEQGVAATVPEKVTTGEGDETSIAVENSTYAL